MCTYANPVLPIKRPLKRVMAAYMGLHDNWMMAPESNSDTEERFKRQLELNRQTPIKIKQYAPVTKIVQASL